MRRKITIANKMNPMMRYAVIAQSKEAIYMDRSNRLGEENLLGMAEVLCEAYDGKKRIAELRVQLLQVPTMQMNVRSAVPSRQVAVDWLCNAAYIHQLHCERVAENDTAMMVMPITTHAYLEKLEVDPAYRRQGIATAMLDFVTALSRPDSICGFIESQKTAQSVVATEFVKQMQFSSVGRFKVDLPWKQADLWVKQTARSV